MYFPFPAESQASSSSLATGGSSPLSPLSFLLVFMPWSAWRGGSWHCEVAPTSTDLLSDAEDVQLLGSLEIPWLLCGLPVCLPAWMGKQHRERDCAGKQEDNRKCHTPVFVRSQNESVPPLVPRLSGINVKDSWLSGSACQHVPTWRKH